MQELALARKECDESGPNSLRKRVLIRLRNTAGAQIGKTLIERALVALSTHPLPLFVGGDTFFESTYPLGSLLLENMYEQQGIANTR